MKFIIKRTSIWEEETCPLKGAVKVSIPYYDQRTFKTVEEYDKKLNEKWLSRGSEHSVNKIGIIRRLDNQTAWEIEINSLEELMRLRKKVGDIIITKRHNTNLDEIEIYDGYRE